MDCCETEEDASVLPAPPSGTFLQVSVGEKHASAVKSDGTVVNWGRTRRIERDVGAPDVASVGGPGFRTARVVEERGG